MKRDLPAHVTRLKGVLYFRRRNWPTRRFENQEIGEAFWKEYARVLNGTAPLPGAFAVKGLITRYYRSPKFDALKPRTQSDYRKFLARMEDRAGLVNVKDIERKHIIAWRDQLAKSESPHYANYFIRVLRLLLEYAIDIGEIERNPARGVGAVKYRKAKPLPWPAEKVADARKALPYDHRTRLLFELLYSTGQRVGDVLKAEWKDIHGTTITVRQNKTGADLVLPLSDELIECLRVAKRQGTTILTNHHGTGPWSYRGAHDAMMKLRKMVNAEAYTIHGIRHTVASELAASGSTDEDIASVTGHSTARMVAHYSGAARQKARAERAQKSRRD